MRIRANHTDGRIARGGHLTVTPEKVLFKPHGFERAVGGTPLEVAADDVVAQLNEVLRRA